jgi:hypothetical protein
MMHHFWCIMEPSLICIIQNDLEALSGVLTDSLVHENVVQKVGQCVDNLGSGREFLQPRTKTVSLRPDEYRTSRAIPSFSFVTPPSSRYDCEWGTARFIVRM